MSHRRVIFSLGHGSATVADTPPSVALTITRLDETTTGSVLVSNGIPLQPGAYTQAMADAGKGRITVGGTERAAYVCGMGRHPDGSYRVALVQFNADPSTETSAAFVPGEVRTTTDLSYTAFVPWDPTSKLPAARVLADPTKAGQPAACALPTDPAYLIPTNFTGPGLCSVSDAAALPGTIADTGRTVGEYAAVCDARFDHWQRDTHVLTSFKGITTTAYPDTDAYPAGQPADWTGETPPQYYDWRTALARYASAQTHHHSYEAPKTFFEMWCRTGTLQYWRLGCALAWSQMYHDRWSINDAGNAIQRFNGYDGFTSRTSAGVGLYFLSTGDREGLDWFTIDTPRTGVAYTYWESVGDETGYNNYNNRLGDFTYGEGEPRVSGRTLSTRYWAWKITRPLAETNLRCGEQLNAEPATGNGRDWLAALDAGLTRLIDGTARLAGGPWTVGGGDYATCNPDAASAVAINTFMQPIVLDALVQVYEDGPTTLTDRADIPAAVKACLDYLDDTLWYTADADRNPSFKNWFSGDVCSPVSSWGSTPDLTGMYPFAWAWYANYSGDTAYKTRARELLRYATGEGTTTTIVDGLYGPYPTSIKQCHEHFCFLQPAFGWLHRAG